jgi:hypothetical protein
MIETVQINWLLLASHFAWILGTAILLVLVVLAFHKHRFPAKLIVISASILIIGGIIFQLLFIPSPNLVMVKVVPKDPGTPFLPRISENLHCFNPNDLKMDPMNRSHPINGKERKDNLLTLFWDGHVSTSFITFPKGRYRATFQARGSDANHEFAKIKIEFESPDTHNIMVTRNRSYIELTQLMKHYNLEFICPGETVGRIRISYFNDFQVAGSHKGRDAWIKNICLEKINDKSGVENET